MLEMESLALEPFASYKGCPSLSVTSIEES